MNNKLYINEKHKEIVKNRGYSYIGSYKCGEVTIDGKCDKKHTYIRVKCPYCDNEFDVIYYNFKKGQNCGKCCNRYENSFAYYIQQELQEPLNKYWDWDKNTVNPYLIYKNRKAKTSKGENWKVWIKCTETDYHGSYETSCHQFTYQNQRCPYCSHKGVSNSVHKKDSYGYKFPELAKYWSLNNNISPFEVSHGSNKKYLHICEQCGDEFERSLHSMTSNDTGCVCNDCQGSKGETMIKRILTNKYNMVKDIDFITQKKFNDLIGSGGRNLSYDFYLPSYNLLIEYQGEFHNGNTRCQTKNQINKQQEHDRRKKQYAIDHNIDLLEIWYWDYENIENILDKTLIN